MMTDSMLTVSEWIQNLTAKRTQSETPQLDSQLLLMFACQRSRAWLIAHGGDQLSGEDAVKVDALLSDFQHGVPMAYITGQQEFWSLPFTVNRSTLIPRPATESLVEWVLQTQPASKPLTVLDLGTGSGALAVSIKSERDAWAVTATDQSKEALCVARKNAESLRLDVEFLQGSWWQPVSARSFDCIVSNPPYIAADDAHLKFLQYEPSTALVAGQDGLQDLSVIAEGVYDHLNDGGWFVVEHGYNQQASVVHKLNEAGLTGVTGHRDLSGQERFVVGQKRGGKSGR
jgi:release factor glutamine methyltransferase